MEDLNASAYGPDGVAIAPVKLAQGVSLPPGAKGALILKLSLDDAVLKMLASHLMGKDQMDVQIRGEVVMRVLGSRVTAPIRMSFPISRADLGIPG